MTVTASKSRTAYKSLCTVLERNGIDYECDSKNLYVKCCVSGKETDINIIFIIDASKMLISLYAPIEIDFSWDKTADMALVLCVINDSISDGHFCFDQTDMGLYFKMTSSFYNSNINDSIFEYMLSVTAEKIDEYYSKINKMTKAWQ